jgi:hypothetical protein
MLQRRESRVRETPAVESQSAAVESQSAR